MGRRVKTRRPILPENKRKSGYLWKEMCEKRLRRVIGPGCISKVLFQSNICFCCEIEGFRQKISGFFLKNM